MTPRVWSHPALPRAPSDVSERFRGGHGLGLSARLLWRALAGDRSRGWGTGADRGQTRFSGRLEAAVMIGMGQLCHVLWTGGGMWVPSRAWDSRPKTVWSVSEGMHPHPCSRRRSTARPVIRPAFQCQEVAPRVGRRPETGTSRTPLVVREREYNNSVELINSPTLYEKNRPADSAITLQLSTLTACF